MCPCRALSVPTAVGMLPGTEGSQRVREGRGSAPAAQGWRRDKTPRGSCAVASCGAELSAGGCPRAGSRWSKTHGCPCRSWSQPPPGAPSCGSRPRAGCRGAMGTRGTARPELLHRAGNVSDVSRAPLHRDPEGPPRRGMRLLEPCSGRGSSASPQHLPALPAPQPRPLLQTLPCPADGG